MQIHRIQDKCAPTPDLQQKLLRLKKHFPYRAALVSRIVRGGDPPALKPLRDLISGHGYNQLCQVVPLMRLNEGVSGLHLERMNVIREWERESQNGEASLDRLFAGLPNE